MDITIIGAGNVGKTLGNRWAKVGHKIIFGIRNPPKYSELLEFPGNIEVQTIGVSIEKSNVIVLAIPGNTVKAFLEENEGLKGKTVIDATNNFSDPEIGVEFHNKIHPSIKFVKAFNTIGFNIMEDPSFGDQIADAFIAGDDTNSLNVAITLASDLDFNPVVVGGISMASNLEALAMLWVKMSRKKGREIAFKLLER